MLGPLLKALAKLGVTPNGLTLLSFLAGLSFCPLWLVSQPAAFLALSLGLGTAACQDMHAFMTGDPFYKASKESPRVEVEVVVDIEGSLYDGLVDVENERELNEAISYVVLSLADVGLRFYPILSQDYGKKDTHPQHRMVVQVQELVIDTEHELVEDRGFVHSTGARRGL